MVCVQEKIRRTFRISRLNPTGVTSDDSQVQACTGSRSTGRHVKIEPGDKDSLGLLNA